jgi:hypothetical protein
MCSTNATEARCSGSNSCLSKFGSDVLSPKLCFVLLLRDFLSHSLRS